MNKIITFGEIMLRLMPEDGHRLLQNERLQATFGGGEANVAVSLANYGSDVAFLTILPDNPLGQAAVNSLRYFGVDTSLIMRQGDRLGVYYVEKGQSQRPSKVIYDRKFSSIAMSKSTDYEWDEIFSQARWFHFTGITPALSPELANACLEACKIAKNMGVSVSCDLNYRKNLWGMEDAYKTMVQLMPYVDLCIANEEDAEKVLGIKAKDTAVDAGQLSYESYQEVAHQITALYGCRYVGITLRTSLNANDNRWAGMLYTDGESHYSRSYDIRVWDRIGGGDSFGGALIYKLIQGSSALEAIEFAVAASCLKHSIEGDFNRCSVEEVEALMRGDSTGRVQR